LKTGKMRTLFVTCVGSHMWGMESPESDIDLVKIYITPTRFILRGEKIPHTVGQKMTERGGVIYDILAWEVGHLINQLINGNVNAIWNAASPLVLQPSPVQAELKRLIEANLCRVTYHSIKGMVWSLIKSEQTRERIAGKGFKTALRTINFGIALLNDGRLCFEPVHHIPEIEEITEKMRQLSEAYETSLLPDLPNEEAFREFLYKLRLEEMDGKKT
jgi:hypothetical protein